MTRLRLGVLIACTALLLAPLVARAEFKVGDPAPDIIAKDINGNTVNLKDVLDKKPDLVVVFFFTPDRAEAIALKLADLDLRLKGFEVVALGMESDKAALQKFATNLGIKYYIIPGSEVANAPWQKDLGVLPVTLFLVTQERTVERVIRGGSTTQGKLLTYAAENYFQQRKLEDAKAIADEAVKSGEDAKDAKELTGYILIADGKIEEATKEFGEIGSNTGLAKAALEQGDTAKAIELAGKSSDGYANTIKAEALMRSGKFDEAKQSVTASLTDNTIPNWQRSEAFNANGRLQHQLGAPDAAVNEYEQAVALDPYNVVALSNEGAALRDTGDLEGAQAALERAQNIRVDDLAVMMLQQIQRELKEANDIERTKLINQQIADLGARFKELKEKGEDTNADSWSTRPLVLALMPGNYTPVFFQRAGTETVIQREIEAKLQEKGEVGVVEREMLDKLLQELNLGSSELADPTTQRTLGKVLSAGMLGFIEFAELGQDKMAYIRLVDSETTAIAASIRQKIDEDHPTEAIEGLVTALTEALTKQEALKGLIADASADDAIVINLGTRHGAKAGQEFNVLEDADPIMIGDKVIARRTRPIGKIVITTIEPDYAVCKVTQRRDGAKIDKEMKIQAAN